VKLVDTVRAWAKRIKRDGVTLWFASKNPHTPWYAKAMGVIVVAYALSPIDLIPDFIPVLGYLDDVILLPALIWLAVRLLPPAVLAESRTKAELWIANSSSKQKSIVGAVAIVVIWVLLASVLSLWAAKALAQQAGHHARATSVMPNPSLKRSANGRPPGPGRRHTVHFHRPGPGVLPLSPA
jgi:uncharacterized membrane protein YkvA (DUF1232 family)